MPGTVRLVWSEELLRHDLGPEHPLRPERLGLTVEMIERLGLAALAEPVAPRTATDAELALCHSPAYIEIVRTLSDSATSEAVEHWARIEAGLGTEDNPIVDDMHHAAALATGGSLVAAESVHEMVERPELAAGLADPAPFRPAAEARERIWRSLERDLSSLSLSLGTPLHLGDH